MAGEGYPMVASHDPRMIAIAERARDRRRPRPRTPGNTRCCTASGRTSSAGWLAAGHTVRIYVPYGHDWYGYFTRRLAERPANLLFFLRSMISKG